MRGETGRGDDGKRPRGNDMRNDPRNERKDLFMKKTLWTLTSAAALLCVAAMATAEAPVATGETAWLRGKPVATYTCAGKTVIPVSALGEYGFDVESGDALKITVNDAEITAEGAPATAGDTLAEVKAETTATLDGQPVVAYTLEDGDAVIALDDCFAYNAEKLSGIDLIVIGTSDLEKSKDFFVTHMELNVVAEGTMDAASVKALYGQEGEAKYAMVMNNVNSTKLMLIEFSEKTGKTTREGFHAWDYGYFDVAWRCNDIDAMYEELTGAGYSFECEPFSYTTSWSGNAVAECVAYGPDGVPTTMILKTTQEFDTKFYNMVDAVLVVDDMASAVDWYTNVMGMDLVYDAPVEKGLVDRVLGIEGTDILRQRPEHADRDSGLLRAGRFHDRAGRLRSGQRRHLHAGVRDQGSGQAAGALRGLRLQDRQRAHDRDPRIRRRDRHGSGQRRERHALSVLSGEIRHCPFGRRGAAASPLF